MRIKLLIFSFLMFGLALGSTPSASPGLSGRHYMEGTFSWADSKEFDATYYGVNLARNYPLTYNVDSFFGIGYSWLNDTVSGVDLEISEVTIQGTLAFRFAPFSSFNPYISGGVAMINGTQKGSIGSVSASEAQSHLAGQLGLGIEMIPMEGFVFTPGISLVYIADQSYTSVGATLGYWVTPKFIPQITFGYNLEDETTGIGITASVLL